MGEGFKSSPINLVLLWILTDSAENGRKSTSKLREQPGQRRVGMTAHGLVQGSGQPTQDIGRGCWETPIHLEILSHHLTPITRRKKVNCVGARKPPIKPCSGKTGKAVAFRMCSGRCLYIILYLKRKGKEVAGERNPLLAQPAQCFLGAYSFICGLVTVTLCLPS